MPTNGHISLGMVHDNYGHRRDGPTPELPTTHIPRPHHYRHNRLHLRHRDVPPRRLSYHLPLRALPGLLLKFTESSKRIAFLRHLLA